jgi:hypothetical protein
VAPRTLSVQSEVPISLSSCGTIRMGRTSLLENEAQREEGMEPNVDEARHAAVRVLRHSPHRSFR